MGMGKVQDTILSRYIEYPKPVSILSVQYMDENTSVFNCAGDLVYRTHRCPVPVLSFCVVLHPLPGASSRVLQSLVNWYWYQNLLFADEQLSPGDHCNGRVLRG